VPNNHIAWVQAQTKYISESLLPLSFNIAGLIAGTIIATSFDTVKLVPWGFMVFPGLLSLRGAIGGMFAGRLSTGLHLGTVNTSLLGNTDYAYTLFSSIVTLTCVSSLALSATSSLFSLIILGRTIADTVHMVGVLMCTLASSVIFISPLTFTLSILSFKRGLDPDVVLYPVISTTADIVITLTYVAVIWLSLRPVGVVFILFMDALLLAVSLRLYAMHRGSESFMETIREFLLTLVVVSVIVNVTGSTLDRVSERIQRFPAVYMSYPAMIDTVGDVGSIVGCTLTTRLALGEVSMSVGDLPRIVRAAVYPWVSSLALFMFYAVASSLMFGLGSLGYLVVRFSLMNLVVVPCIVAVVLLVTKLTYGRGLDPDNFIIPIETTLADTITTVALLLVLMIGG